MSSQYFLKEYSKDKHFLVLLGVRECECFAFSEWFASLESPIKDSICHIKEREIKNVMCLKSITNLYFHTFFKKQNPSQ